MFKLGKYNKQSQYFQKQNIQQYMYNYNTYLTIQDDARGFRWDPAIIHWAHSLRFARGQMVMDLLRGRSTQGSECKCITCE
jgi:hypothetical protein